MNETKATACCLCCVAAAERDELDHLVSNECPLGGCDYHHPLTPSAVGAARERLYGEKPETSEAEPDAEAVAAHLVENPAVLVELVEMYAAGYGSGLATATLNYEMASGVPREAARRHSDAVFVDWRNEFYRDPAIRAVFEQAVRAHLTRTDHEPIETKAGF